MNEHKQETDECNDQWQEATQRLVEEDEVDHDSLQEEEDDDAVFQANEAIGDEQLWFHSECEFAFACDYLQFLVPNLSFLGFSLNWVRWVPWTLGLPTRERMNRMVKR